MKAGISRFANTTHTSRRSFLAISAGGALALVGGRSLSVLAAGGGEYEEGKPIPSDYSFENGTYVVTDEKVLYQYATGGDGYAYYTSYEDNEWSDWAVAGDMQVGWDPAPVMYDGKSQAYYTGKDGYMYELTRDSYGDAQWEDILGGYMFEASPYAIVWEDAVCLAGTSTDGSWTEWMALNDDEYPAKTSSKPYSVAWSGHENTFWVGEDDKMYWNRYNFADQTWAGAREIPADYSFSTTPYAVGYAPEKQLYAFSSDAEGKPTWNTFADGAGWSGWETYETDWSAKGQPNAYVYDDTMHLAYTGGTTWSTAPMAGAMGGPIWVTTTGTIPTSTPTMVTCT